MAVDDSAKSRIQASSLLGVLKFLRKYRRGALLAVGLLLINIAIEMTLPQILGSAITGLRDSAAGRGDFPLDVYVKIFVGLVLIRAGVGFILGPIRNRVIQRTLGDIRAAIYDAIQRLSFTYHDKANSGELISRSTTDVWRLQDFFYASKLQPKWRQVHDLHGAMTTVIQENIAGVRVVKAFARENAEIAKFRGRKETYL